jgi:hypothetical protein
MFALASMPLTVVKCEDKNVMVWMKNLQAMGNVFELKTHVIEISIAFVVNPNVQVHHKGRFSQGSLVDAAIDFHCCLCVYVR